jgi:hypothetical protein
MQLTLKPYLTTGVVLVGATAMVAAPIQVMPPDISIAPSHSVSNVAVQPAALVEDLLNAINVISVANGDFTKYGLDSIAGFPLQLAILTQAAINDPSLIPQLGSFQLYKAAGSLSALEGPVFSLASLLPPPLGPGANPVTDPGLVLEAFAKFGDLVADALSNVPPPTADTVAALTAAAGDLPDRVSSFLTAFETLVGSFGEAVGGGYVPFPGLGETPGTAAWFGIAPTLLAVTMQAAIDEPSTIPGLASYLVYSVLSPPTAPTGSFPPPPVPGGTYSLFVNAFGPILAAIEDTTPDPVADAVEQLSLKLNTVLTNGLAHLPAPDNPFIPGPPAVMAAAKAPTVTSGPAALPHPGALLRSSLSQNTLSAKDPKAVAKPGDVIKSVAAHLPGPGKVNASDIVKAAQAQQAKVAGKVKAAVAKATGHDTEAAK